MRKKLPPPENTLSQPSQQSQQQQQQQQQDYLAPEDYVVQDEIFKVAHCSLAVILPMKFLQSCRSCALWLEMLGSLQAGFLWHPADL